MTTTKAFRCDFGFGRRPGERRCPVSAAFVCRCPRCESEDASGKFRSCASHRDDVVVVHGRIYPSHTVRWEALEPLEAALSRLEKEVAAFAKKMEAAFRVGFFIPIQEPPELIGWLGWTKTRGIYFCNKRGDHLSLQDMDIEDTVRVAPYLTQLWEKGVAEQERVQSMVLIVCPQLERPGEILDAEGG